MTRQLGAVRKYLFLARQSAQEALEYRLALLTSLGVTLLQVAALYYLWTAVYSETIRLGGLSRRQTLTYLCVAFAVNQLVGWGVENNIGRAIRDGSIAMELLMPLDHQFAKFWAAAGTIIIQGGMLSVLTIAVALSLLDITPPAGVSAAFFFAVSITLSALIAFSLAYLTSMIFFWTSSPFGVLEVKRLVVDALSGALIPLTFFPDQVRGILLALPFGAIVHSPVAIYLGLLSGRDCLRTLLIQLCWAIALWFAGRLLFAWAVRRLTVHGG